MKIGILTYHRSVNEGSVIQAYCLQKLLMSLVPDSVVEIIDYRPKAVEKRDFIKCFNRRFPFINLVQFYKRKMLHTFLKENCILSGQKCKSDNLADARRFVEKQNYDAIIVGSDTVWRVRDNKGDLLAPNLYYLPEIDGLRKIAFAVSFDLTDKRLLTDSRRIEISRMIKSFDFISVRDEMSSRYIKEFGLPEKEIIFLPDPTLLWDFASLVKPVKIRNRNRPLAGVAVPEISIREQLTGYLLQKGFQVLNLLGNPVTGQLHVPFHYSLKQRLGLYRLLDLMVTDRFHQCIFSLKLGGIPLILLENSRKYPTGTLSKGRDLFQRLDIEWAVCRYSASVNLRSCAEKVLSKWKNEQSDIKLKFKDLNDYALPILMRLVNTFHRI